MLPAYHKLLVSLNIYMCSKVECDGCSTIKTLYFDNFWGGATALLAPRYVRSWLYLTILLHWYAESSGHSKRDYFLIHPVDLVDSEFVFGYPQISVSGSLGNFRRPPESPALKGWRFGKLWWDSHSPWWIKNQLFVRYFCLIGKYVSISAKSSIFQNLVGKNYRSNTL